MKKIKILVFLLVAAVMLTGCDSSDYKKATGLYESGNYDEAYEAFTELGDYKDSADMAKSSHYKKASVLYENGNYKEACEVFTGLGDYEDSANMADLSRLAYAQELVTQSKYNDAVKVFQALGDMDGIDEVLDNIADSLMFEDDYKNAKLFLYRHSEDEEKMKEFSYQFLLWQMENYDYTQTATTFNAIKGYRDTLTNEKFFGAHLMAMKKLTYHISDISFRRMSGGVLIYYLSFSQGRLIFDIYGGNMSLYSGAFSDEVDISDNWPYKFEGKEIYIKENGEYVKCGTIFGFNEDKSGNKETVTLSLDLPGMMSITECDFEPYTT